MNGQSVASTLVDMVQNVWENVLEGWRARERFGEIVRYPVSCLCWAVFALHLGKV